MKLGGQKVLVTGASSGIGRHFSLLSAANGATVICVARRAAALDDLCAEIAKAGGRGVAVAMDVADPASVEEAFERLDREALAPDVVINNAGISEAAPALEISSDSWDRVVDTNLKGVFLVAQAAAKRMDAAGRGGAIVNVASILGYRVAGALASYAASKGGVVRLTEALALEWARYGIRVNALCPGYIETEINRGFFETDAGKAMIKRIPQRRIGALEDLDGALLLLASDAGRYMTGSSIVVDGGHLVSSL